VEKCDPIPFCQAQKSSLFQRLFYLKAFFWFIKNEMVFHGFPKGGLFVQTFGAFVH
jgi:hypothetical protein